MRNGGYPGEDLKLRQNSKLKTFRFCFLHFLLLVSDLNPPQVAPFLTTLIVRYFILRIPDFMIDNKNLVFARIVNPFDPNAPFLYPLKKTEKP